MSGTVILQLSSSRLAVFRQVSTFHQAVVRQLSGSRPAVVRKMPGSRQKNAWQSSGSFQVVIRHFKSSICHLSYMGNETESISVLFYQILTFLKIFWHRNLPIELKIFGHDADNIIPRSHMYGLELVKEWVAKIHLSGFENLVYMAKSLNLSIYMGIYHMPAIITRSWL